MLNNHPQVVSMIVLSSQFRQYSRYLHHVFFRHSKMGSDTLLQERGIKMDQIHKSLIPEKVKVP